MFFFILQSKSYYLGEVDWLHITFKMSLQLC